MASFSDLYNLINATHLAIKRNANAALNQGNTRGLSVDDVILLATISDSEDLTMLALAMRTDRDIASVSRQVSSLCVRGWLTKKPGKIDARERIVTLTDRAQNVLQEAHAQLNNVFSVMTSRLSLTEKKEFFRMLGTLLEP